MNITISKNFEETSLFVAKYIQEAIQSHQNKNPSTPFVLGLPTGGSIIEVYKHLIAFHKASALSFKNVVTFNMDEYIGLSPTDKNSYAYFMHHHLFDHIDIPQENINLPDGCAKDIQKHNEEYEHRIKSYGGINLFVGGLGENAHLAFNEPFSSFQSTTHIAQLNEDTRVINARFFNSLDEVPTQAISVGIKTVTDAQKVIIIIVGRKKAFALQKIVEEGVNLMYPASALQLHNDVLLACDEDAAENLMVKNYKMFKGSL